MNRVLVTGATGFVGRHVLRPLARAGFEVHGVARKRAEIPAVTWHQADLLNPQQRRALIETTRPTHLLHLSWCTEHRSFWTDASNLTWAAATLDLVERFHSTCGERVVMTGTCAEYDWSVVDGPVHETSTPRRPSTLYGQAKLSTQELLSAYARQVGLSHAWAVLFFLFGPYDNPARLVPSVISAVLADRPISLTSGGQVQDFLPVAEAGSALAQLLASDVEGRVNIASGKGLAAAQLAGQIARLMGKPGLIETLSPGAPQKAPRSLTADITRLHNEVGFASQQDYDSALLSTIEWWVSRLTDLSHPSAGR